MLKIITENMWIASVDLEDAFRKYFRFIWVNRYKFIGMTNGFGQAIRVFTKQVKQAFSFLRVHGYQSVIFVDDTLIYKTKYLLNVLTMCHAFTHTIFLLIHNYVPFSKLRGSCHRTLSLYLLASTHQRNLKRRIRSTTLAGSF